jgi:hypothetical protein
MHAKPPISADQRHPPCGRSYREAKRLAAEHDLTELIALVVGVRSRTSTVTHADSAQ